MPRAAYKLFALNVATGESTKPPIVVDGSSGAAHFVPNGQKQRSALLLASGLIGRRFAPPRAGVRQSLTKTSWRSRCLTGF